MIKRIQIDNYRCFSNFEWAPGQFALLLGENGAGKTSMFDVLESLRDIITKGHATDEIFPANTLCRFFWQLRGSTLN
jgi:predicted ATPase